MKCDRCGCLIGKSQEMEYQGQLLCEDCYMDVLSPAKPCDPWAVYLAKSLSNKQSALTKIQEDILKILRETDGLEPEVLAEKLNLKLSDLEREFATLRHMEKTKAAMKDGKKIICLW